MTAFTLDRNISTLFFNMMLPADTFHLNLYSQLMYLQIMLPVHWTLLHSSALKFLKQDTYVILFFYLFIYYPLRRIHCKTQKMWVGCSAVWCRVADNHSGSAHHVDSSGQVDEHAWTRRLTLLSKDELAWCFQRESESSNLHLHLHTWPQLSEQRNVSSKDNIVW